MAQTVDGEVVQNGEYPGPCIAVFAAPAPAGDDPLQAILYEIIRRHLVAQQGARIAPQRRNKRLDQAHHIIHGHGFTPRNSQFSRDVSLGSKLPDLTASPNPYWLQEILLHRDVDEAEVAFIPPISQNF